jgi:hypothetical protein
LQVRRIEKIQSGRSSITKKMVERERERERDRQTETERSTGSEGSRIEEIKLVVPLQGLHCHHRRVTKKEKEKEKERERGRQGIEGRSGRIKENDKKK